MPLDFPGPIAETFDQMESMREELVEIAAFNKLETAHEYGLVILSQHAPYWISKEGNKFSLLVETERAKDLQEQLTRYEQESVNWPPPPPEFPEESISLNPATTWLAVMIVSHYFSFRFPEWKLFGRLSAEAVAGGEYYRALTALFLHTDIAHLVSNVVFGAFFLHLVAKHIGSFTAWAGVLIAGTAGNLLNTWIYYPEPHFAVGASTAIFGAIGILASLPAGLILGKYKSFSFKTWGLPFITGLIMLGWFGTGDAKTDTTAHLTGFLCGLPFGFLAGLLRFKGLSQHDNIKATSATD